MGIAELTRNAVDVLPAGGLEKKLALPSFADKAPKEVVAEAKAQLEELKRKRAVLEEARGLAAELGE